MNINITQSGRDFFDEQTNLGSEMGPFSHIVSIVCPDDKTLVTPISDKHIILKMWDVDKVMEDQFRKYEPPDKLLCTKAVMKAHEWYEDANANNDFFNLLIHCDAGISRSSAITLGVLWNLSGLFFKSFENTHLENHKDYLELRKLACKEMVNKDISFNLFRFIDGRFNPGVKPNQAIMKIYRNYFKDFPW